MSFENVSADVIWEICNGRNALLCKRKMSGGVQLSRDPLNLVNKHSRKYEGFVNQTAIGIHPSADGKSLRMMTKKPGSGHKPKSALSTTKFASTTGTRKTYRAIVNSTAKHSYRADLRREAVARASAIRMSQLPKKELPRRKLRGSKAKKAKETAE